MNWKQLVALMLYIACGAGLYAQTIKTPPNPAPPVARAHFCGNLVINTAGKTATFESLQAEGCPVTHFVDLGGDYWLAYGVKVTIESP